MPNPNLSSALRWLRAYQRHRPGLCLSHNARARGKPDHLTPALYSVSRTFNVPYPALREAWSAHLRTLATPPTAKPKGRRRTNSIPAHNARVLSGVGHGDPIPPSRPLSNSGVLHHHPPRARTL